MTISKTCMKKAVAEATKREAGSKFRKAISAKSSKNSSRSML